jgi:hypothetical protein
MPKRLWREVADRIRHFLTRRHHAVIPAPRRESIFQRARRVDNWVPASAGTTPVVPALCDCSMCRRLLRTHSLIRGISRSLEASERRALIDFGALIAGRRILPFQVPWRRRRVISAIKIGRIVFPLPFFLPPRQLLLGAPFRSIFSFFRFDACLLPIGPAAMAAIARPEAVPPTAHAAILFGPFFNARGGTAGRRPPVRAAARFTFAAGALRYGGRLNFPMAVHLNVHGAIVVVNVDPPRLAVDAPAIICRPPAVIWFRRARVVPAAGYALDIGVYPGTG